MHCYNEREGYKEYVVALGELCPIFNENKFHLLEAWTKNNLMYMVVAPISGDLASSYSKYSPIIYIDLEALEAKPLFIEWRMGEEAKQLSKAYSIEDYCILVSRKE